MKLALKIDVDTYRGTREGVPRLMDALTKAGAGATFLFSLGPDHTGRAIKRAFRPGFMSKVSRTSVVKHYGVKTLLYGTLLPGPDIGVKCAELMRAVKAAGFEVGIHTWDHVKWQDGVEAADNAWVEAQMQQACSRFVEIFGMPARVHGAAGWQMNRHAFRMTQRLGFAYCSDTRGTHPFVPIVDGEIVACPQLPTTLPTLDELIGADMLTPNNVHDHLLQLTRPAGNTTRDGGGTHVYTLHAELEGMKLTHVFGRLLEGWRDQGYEIVSMENLLEAVTVSGLPRHRIEMNGIPGRSGTLAVQGPLVAAPV